MESKTACQEFLKLLNEVEILASQFKQKSTALDLAKDALRIQFLKDCANSDKGVILPDGTPLQVMISWTDYSGRDTNLTVPVKSINAAYLQVQVPGLNNFYKTEQGKIVSHAQFPLHRVQDQWVDVTFDLLHNGASRLDVQTDLLLRCHFIEAAVKYYTRR